MSPGGWRRSCGGRRPSIIGRCFGPGRSWPPWRSRRIARPSGNRAALEVEETRLEVLRVLDEMPERQRLALEWKYLDGLGVREIAERLGESERAVEAVLYRARRGFRQAFEPKRMAK